VRLRALAVGLLLLPALASAQPFTFVSTPASDALAVVDLSDHTLAGTVPLGGLPSGCAVGPHGARLYVARSQSNTLAVINMASGAVTSIPVGMGPSGVAVGGGGRRVYVANTGDDTVSVVDGARGVGVATIPVGSAPLDVVAGAQQVYVGNWGSHTVSVIDAASNVVRATLPVGRFPAGLALHRTTRRLYVANFFDDTVSVIDTATLSVVGTFPVARRPRSLVVDASGQRLFVAGFEDSRVQVVNTATGTILTEAASGGLNPLDLMLGPDGTRLYVAHVQETQGVAVLDAATLAPVTSVDVPAGPLAFAGLAATMPPAPFGGALLSAARSVAGALRGAGGSASHMPARSASLGDEVVISETEFNVADWAISGGGEWDVSQETTGGNPGAWRRVTHFGPANTTHRLIRPGTGYDPSSQGAIDRIDVSWDRRIFAETLVSERFLVEQNNVVYRTVERTFFAPAWENDSRLGLRADAFDNGAGGHPDFSENGGPLRFGYVRQTAFQQTVPHGIDNFIVTVRRTPPNLAGRMAFQKTTDVVIETDNPFVLVDRLDGAAGAVSVDVTTQRPDGTSIVETLNWADGDNTVRSVLVVQLNLPNGSGARTARLTLGNPTGGAILENTRDSMVMIVFPEDWPDVLQALYLRLQGLLGAWSPAWLVALAATAALMARGSRT
jgi:YVTN family beta-propeller protein